MDKSYDTICICIIGKIASPLVPTLHATGNKCYEKRITVSTLLRAMSDGRKNQRVFKRQILVQELYITYKKKTPVNLSVMLSSLGFNPILIFSKDYLLCELYCFKTTIKTLQWSGSVRQWRRVRLPVRLAGNQLHLAGLLTTVHERRYVL